MQYPVPMDVPEQIEAFLDGDPFAVAGASTNREKYGNKVLRAYLQNGRDAWPINPRADEIEGVPCYPDLEALPGTPHGLSIITPPALTEGILDAADRLDKDDRLKLMAIMDEIKLELTDDALQGDFGEDTE